MKVNFKSAKLEKQLTEPRALLKAFNKPMAQKISDRLSEFAVVENLAELRRYAGARCHELTGNRKGQLAVDLMHPFRLVFVPDHHSVPSKADGGLDWNSVTVIEIIEVTDYH